jgi:carbonic anhydrase/acetyltransferase-like protein (isoleucine patch superfamily)
MGPKYEFTDETINHKGHLLHRIKRLSNGELGGWIEKEDNLSQEGNCWVDGNAYVYDDASVYGNAKVYRNAEVMGNAKIYGNAKVYDSAYVYGNAKIYGNAEVEGYAKVYEDAEVYEDAKVYGNAEVYGQAKVYGNALICGWANVYGNAIVYCNAEVCGHAKVYGNVVVAGKSQVYGNAELYGIHLLIDANINDEVLSNDSPKEVIQDFIYKVDDSNKLTTQTEYESIDEFFSSSIANDIKLDTLIICSVDTKEPLIKLQKVETENKTEYKFIVDITNEDGDNFMFQSIIKSQEQLNQLIQQTVDALKSYSKFSKYIDDLANCL